MKNFVTVVGLLVLLGGIWASPAHAGETEYRFDPVSQKSRPLIFTNTYPGYLVFREVCKRCHTRDNPEAPFLYSESKTQKAWKRVFLTRYPECAKKGYWDEIPPEKMLQLHDYLHSEARDHYNPYSAKGNC